MNGAMMSATSRLAMASAVGLLLSLGSAKAADLGGNCCADLEERVAELEATTARKGNRKVSLTVNGQVSRAIMFFNDGNLSKTVAGVDSRVESTRFFFTGNAKITPRVTAGFEFMVDIGLGAQSSGVSNAPGGTPGQNTPAGSPNVDGNWGGDGVLAVRTANWYLEDSGLGRVTVGRVNVGGAVATIDLGGIGTGATARPTLFGGSLQFRNAAGGLSGLTITTGGFGHCQGCDRGEGIVYETPSIGGLLLRAYWGENDLYSWSARYAGEHHGFQIAAGIGMQGQSKVGQVDGSGPTVAAVTIAGTTFGQYGLGSTAARPADDWGTSLALRHVASGIFVQGEYLWSNYRIDAGNGADKTQSTWMIQAGIARNLTGLGDTAFYGEYGEGKDNIFETGQFGASSKSTLWGLGLNQKVDAAAMELYLGYRRFDLSATGTTAATAGPYKDIDLVFSGARIRF